MRYEASSLLWFSVGDLLTRALNDLVEVWKMLVNVIYPFTLLGANTVSGAGVGQAPFIDKLARVTEFCGNGWDSKFREGPVVLVTAECKTHYFFAGAEHGSRWEMCLF